MLHASFCVNYQGPNVECRDILLVASTVLPSALPLWGVAERARPIFNFDLPSDIKVLTSGPAARDRTLRERLRRGSRIRRVLFEIRRTVTLGD